MKPIYFYGITSFAGVLLAGGLLFFFVQRVAIGDVTELAERGNLALAQTALTVVRSDVADMLDATKDATIIPAQVPRLPGALNLAVNDLMRNPAVVRLKIYNQHGVVVFSTKFDQIGQMQDGNEAFDAVMKGKVVSGVAYRGAVNPYDKHTEERHLIQTYMPVQRSATEPILGVLEIYTDANSVVGRNERAQKEVFAVIALVLALLYLTLFLAARHATNAIDVQQSGIRARLATLESLSAQLLSAEEEDRRTIALELHESIAQSLCGIKIRLEHLPHDSREDDGHWAREGLQSVIEDVRTLASRLRPAGLDQLGLLTTVQGFCDSYERQHPDIGLDMHLELQEDDVPPPLKIVVYRVVESTLGNIARRSGGGRVHLDLRHHGDSFEIAVDHRPLEAGYLAALLRHDGEYTLSLAKIEEQVKLSGGTFAVKTNAMLGVVVRASWPGVPGELPTLGPSRQ